MKRLVLRRRFFIFKMIGLKRKIQAFSNAKVKPFSWKRAGESFERLIKENRDEIIRLCDARTYRDLYLEDGIEPPV